MVDQDVPLPLRRLWRIPAASRLGRTPELDVDRVVNAAVSLADRDGLDGVSLPRVAKALGFTTMSLYRHVGSKDELLDLMADHAFADYDAPRHNDDWRADLRAWAAAQKRLYHHRCWLARIPLSGPPTGPHQVTFMETGLRALSTTTLDWHQKLGILTLISGWVRQASLMFEELAQGREATGLDQAQAERRYGRSLTQLVDPDRFPQTAMMLGSGVFESTGPRTEDAAVQPEFVFGLERILDGVATLVDHNPLES